MIWFCNFSINTMTLVVHSIQQIILWHFNIIERTANNRRKKRNRYRKLMMKKLKNLVKSVVVSSFDLMIFCFFCHYINWQKKEDNFATNSDIAPLDCQCSNYIWYNIISGIIIIEFFLLKPPQWDHWYKFVKILRQLKWYDFYYFNL